MPVAVTASMPYDLVTCPHRVTMDLYGVVLPFTKRIVEQVDVVSNAIFIQELVELLFVHPV
jgi:hypothetical protein